MKTGFGYADIHFTHHAWRPLGLWVLTAVVLNILFGTANGYAGDMNYWFDWTNQLQTRGYSELNANYPPLYVHWLWLIAQFETGLHLVVSQDPLLRFLTNTPVLASHAMLLLLLDTLLQRAAVTDRQWNLTIGFAALNPAILLDGPLWGQVDLLFCLMTVTALALLIEARRLAWVFPLLVLAVLTKFQTICVAPLVLPLLWHRRRSKALWLGLLPALVLGVLLLLPYMLTGSLWNMISLAYLKASSMYPYATLNGNNLWFMLGLNSRPDNIFIFDLFEHAAPWQKYFTAKILGIFLCAVWGLGIAISSFRHDDGETHWRNGFLAAVGFFLFLPGMHERYLLPAVVIALCAAARYPRFLLPAICLAALSSINMLFVLHVNGGVVGIANSALTILFAIFAITSARLGRLPWLRWAGSIGLRWWGALAIGIWAIMLCIYLLPMLPDSKGWIDATSLKGRTTSQGWGELQIGNSVDGRVLKVNKLRYASGFGTHATSSITLSIPVGADSFSVLAGIDDESTAGEVEFLVMLDGDTVWRSGPVRSGEAPRKVVLDLHGHKKLDLIVDSLGDMQGDHADWLSPRFHVKR
ncbi:MAG: hypothetical protein JWL63_2118 [Rhodocyclales bacterium]|nr:hypothetical protein [Rhodocyclales bacterium]